MVFGPDVGDDEPVRLVHVDEAARLAIVEPQLLVRQQDQDRSDPLRLDRSDIL